MFTAQGRSPRTINNRQRGLFWMGCRTVEVRFPQVKEEIRSRKVSKRTRRSHRAGTRTSRVIGSTDKASRSRTITSNLAVNRPPAFKKTPRQRFSSWVDRGVNRIASQLLYHADRESITRWESSDFDPRRVPYKSDVLRDGRVVWCSKALSIRRNLLRTITRIYKAPPPFYLEKGLSVKLRTWRSGGLFHPETGWRVSETDRFPSGYQYLTGRYSFCTGCGGRFDMSLLERRTCAACRVRQDRDNWGRATQRRGRPRRGR